MCFLTELNDLFAACVFGNNTLFKSGYVIGISKCTFDNRVSELNVRRKLCLSVLGNILCIAVVCERKRLTGALGQFFSESVVFSDFFINLGRNALCSNGVISSYSCLIAITKYRDNLTLVVESCCKVFCLFIELGYVSLTHSVVVIASVFFEKTIILSELLTELTLALSEFALAYLVSLTLLARGCAESSISVVIVVYLAYVRER